MHALGYVVERANLARSGRELDLLARHRVEPRMALTECKAQEEKVGGSDINKFVGSLDAERRRSNDPITGYFVSLSGFKDSALEQEAEFGGARCILLGPDRIISELENARIIVAESRAIMSAARFAADRDLEPAENAQLLATEVGWIWLVQYQHHGVHESFMMIHADGHPLPHATALEIGIATGLDPNQIANNTFSVTPSEMIQEYRRSVISQYGPVTHEGLPADATVAQSFSLQDLYVPLKLDPWRETERGDTQSIPQADVPIRVSLSQAMNESRQVSILGSPGSGKSTLLRRVAISYCDPSDKFRHEAFLPNGDLLPILIRCREVAVANQDLLSCVGSLPRQFGRPELSDRFLHLAMETFRNGTALLLIDGLDEIPSSGDRTTFVKQVRNFLATYPRVRVLVTSREPGFRPVAGILADHCTAYKVRDLDAHDIRLLVQRWHQLVPRRTSTVPSPDQLATTILSNTRLRLLAVNPLLLTTLLLVERWVGNLPRKRSILYDKAIEVLLITWNVEGHEPLNLDETLPQLAYVAYRMTESGEQRISRNDLVDMLHDARRDMPDVLGYSSIGARELIDRIELRSSLLMLAGHAVKDGRLQPQYEYKHLTFQEYLAALACVNGWTPGGEISSPVDILRVHYSDPKWSETIALAASLAGRKGGPLVRDIVGVIRKMAAELNGSDPDLEWDPTYEDLLNAVHIVAACLVDEVPMQPEHVREALLTCIEHWNFHEDSPLSAFSRILAGRYGGELRTAEASIGGTDNHLLSQRCNVASEICEADLTSLKPRPNLLSFLSAYLGSENTVQRVQACAFIATLSYRLDQHGPDIFEDQDERHQVLEVYEKIVGAVLALYEDDTLPAIVTVASCWALNWLLANRDDVALAQRILDRSSQIVLDVPDHPARDYSCWSISSICTIDRQYLNLSLSEKREAQIREMYDQARQSRYNFTHEYSATFALAYLGKLVPGDEMRRELGVLRSHLPRRLTQLLQAADSLD